MGARLVKYYEFTQNQAGIVGRMRLALKVRMTSEKAKSEPDSPELVQKMKDAVREITGEEPAF
jgi:hypothetical protein